MLSRAVCRIFFFFQVILSNTPASEIAGCANISSPLPKAYLIFIQLVFSVQKHLADYYIRKKSTTSSLGIVYHFCMNKWSADYSVDGHILLLDIQSLKPSPSALHVPCVSGWKMNLGKSELKRLTTTFSYIIYCYTWHTRVEVSTKFNTLSVNSILVNSLSVIIGHCDTFPHQYQFNRLNTVLSTIILLKCIFLLHIFLTRLTGLRQAFLWKREVSKDISCFYWSPGDMWV